ncbi:MAG: hypothetical protein DI606_10550 [Sphingobium sp.]|nr:MAG: hypothetical protein DI606_10550 [Sphingobium sp.]
MHVRQVKLERGQVATPYSADATIVQAFDTLSSVNQQYASLSQTVSTQGVTVGQHSTAITTINGQVATLAGKYTVGVDAGGRWTGLEINGSPTSGGVKIRGDYLTIENPNGGARTEYRNGYWLATDGQSWMSIWGAPFGNGNRFLRWSGPYFSDLNNCQESNAKEYLRVDGSMYFGGALLAGTLRNSNSTSILAANASTSVGPFGSNGGQIVVAASWSWNSTDTASYPATAQGRSNYDAAIQNLQANGYNITGSNQGGHFGSKTDNKDGNAFALYLNRNGGQVAAEGGCAGSISIEGTRPEPVDNQPGYIRYTYLYSKSITWTDPDRSTMQRTMTATIQRNFTPSGTADQRIGINTVE